MCKILIIPGLDPKKKELNFKFMAQMADLMSKSNDDGLGYAAIDSSGKMFGERWLLNHEAFDQRKIQFTKGRKADPSIMKSPKMDLGDFTDLEEEKDIPPMRKFGTFGETNDSIVAAILHARKATNAVCYQNIHPFVDEEKNTAIIHNGIISNHTEADKIRSTCDSERILNKYLEHSIGSNPLVIQKLVNDLKGWFAVGAFAKDKDGRWVVDIFKSGAQLSCGYVKELDAMVFSTSLDDIRAACFMLGLTLVSVARSGVREDMLLRLDAVSGKRLITVKYKDTRHSYNYSHGGGGLSHKDLMDAAQSDDDAYQSLLSHWHQQQDDEKRKEQEAAQLRMDEKRKAKDERKAANAGTSNVVSLPQFEPEHRPTESQQQEASELKRAGMDEEDIRTNEIRKRVDEFKSNGWSNEDAERVASKEVDELLFRRKIRKQAEEFGVKHNWTADAVDNYERNVLRTKNLPVTMKNAKEIVTVYDPLNENKAAAADYYYVKEHNLWLKRVNMKH